MTAQAKHLTTGLAMPPDALAILQRLSESSRALWQRTRRHYAPPPRMNIADWAEAHRILTSGEAKGSRLRWDVTPALRLVAAAYHDPTVRELWLQKASQLGYTQAVVMSIIGYHMHLDPCPILIIFSKDAEIKQFMLKKLRPMIRATPVLRDLVDLSSRSSTSTLDYLEYPGGFIQLAGVGSPVNVKSTDYKLVIVEEPDELTKKMGKSKDNVGQGDSITNARERLKQFGGSKLVAGGSPTTEGHSNVHSGMQLTDQRRLHVPCPHCGHQQVLRWENVKWLKNAEIPHPVYGKHQPETAKYQCEAEDCGALWSESERRQALNHITEVPGQRFTGNAGFYISELYSKFAGSTLPQLVKKFIPAAKAAAKGDDSKLIVFINNQLGETYSVKPNAPEHDQLIERGEQYAPWTVPAGGLVCTAFVDLQRGGEKSGNPRLEWGIVAWGRDMESWRVANGVCNGHPNNPDTWKPLADLWAKPIKNLGGGHLHVSWVGVDTGDGETAEAAYRYCRANYAKGVRPTKGSGDHRKQIYNPPGRSVDHDATGKAAKFGLKIFEVGTIRAKDLFYGHLRIVNPGPGHMHWPASIAPSYLQQWLAESRVPNPRTGHPSYVVQGQQANEGLDIEVGCLHGAYALNLHRWTHLQWDEHEKTVRQRSLLTTDDGARVARSDDDDLEAYKV